MSDLLFAALMIGGVGLVVGIFLGFASKVFHVDVDQKELDVRAALPGANCGACGYSGCGALAAAIVAGNAPVNACVVGQAPVANRIKEIVGGGDAAAERKVAFVRCSGSCDKTYDRYTYTGPMSCAVMKFAPEGGPKSCSFGCIGCGDCTKECDFGAISIRKGIAVVDEEKCVDCKKCMKACPKNAIIEVPYGRVSHIGCMNPLKGKVVTANCKIGCITCTKCARNCPQEAIDLSGGYPVIDYEKCNDCGLCRENCPKKCIV